MDLTTAVADVMGAVAHLRHGSAIHEVGTAHDGRLRTTGGGPGPFADRTEQRVVVRLSRALGLPPPLPDVFGLGIRLGPADRPQDLLLEACGPDPLTRHALAVRRDFAAGPLGSLVALDDGTRRFHLAAFPRTPTALRDLSSAAGTTFVLAVAPPYGRWTTVGAVRLDAVSDDQDVRLSPDHTALGVTLSPWWQRFRVTSYRSSRRRAQEAGATR